MSIALVRPSRKAIIARARFLRVEIQQIFDDAAHWNRINPNQENINPDPDGELRAIAEGIDAMLAKEE
jgi:hypothetical protein